MLSECPHCNANIDKESDETCPQCGNILNKETLVF